MLGRFLKIVHKKHSRLGMQMFDTLIELIQGPNKPNIEVLLSYRVIEFCRDLMEVFSDNNQAILRD